MNSLAELFPDDCPIALLDNARRFGLSHGLDIEAWWRDAPQGDWMIWCAGKLGTDLKSLVKAATECARTALRFVPQGESRPSEALDLAERWTIGAASAQECSNVADKLHHECDLGAAFGGGMDAVAAMTAVGAAEAAVNAAGQAHDRMLSITLACQAARRAAIAANHVHGQEAKDEANRKCADAVRRMVPRPNL
jgi:hypothetical protein